MAESRHMTTEDEFGELKARFGGVPVLASATVEYADARFFKSRQSAYRDERRGEVVFAVQRPSGRFVVTRMSEYPHGVFRLPSGGISYGEGVVAALEREILEELGLVTEVERFLGVIKYDIRHGAEATEFVSYVFHMREVGGRIMADAADDEVSEFREVDAAGLQAVAYTLRSIADSWRDWGGFRAIAVEFVQASMKGIQL